MQTQNVTSELMREHELILEWMDLLDEFVRRSDGSFENSPLATAAPVFAGFIENFADRLHHAKEEGVLFETLSRPGVLTHCNPLPQMLHEHDTGRGLRAEMLQAHRVGDLPRLVDSCMQIGALYYHHIQKEDHILYAMAEEGIPHEQRPLILARYADADKLHGAPELWTRYRRELEELRSLIRTRSGG